MTFYFYDLETFGINPKTARIAQFAGIRTDEQFNILSQDMFYAQPTGDSLPDPEACLVTGITPQLCAKKGLPEYQFIQKILGLFSQANTCILGYNNIRFDDEFIRHTAYRNLLEPYAWAYKNGNTRFDLLDVVRFCYALKPNNSLNWAYVEDEQGKPTPSFKLDQLAPKNGIEHSSAHDALADVIATIGIAKKIKQTQAQLFDYAFSLRDKKNVASLIKPLTPVLHTSGMYPASDSCTKLTTVLGYHPNYKDRAIVFDLSQNPNIFLDKTPQILKELLYTKQTELLAGQERLRLKELTFNKSPMFVLSKKPPSHLKIDTNQCLKNLEWIKKHHSEILIKILAMYQDSSFESNISDVDQLIYAGFIQNKDRKTLDNIVFMDAQQLTDYQPEFIDARLPKLLLHYKARNFPSSLNEQDSEQWFEIVQNRLQEGIDGYLSIENYQQKISILDQHYPDKKPLWQALIEYADTLV